MDYVFMKLVIRYQFPSWIYPCARDVNEQLDTQYNVQAIGHANLSTSVLNSKMLRLLIQFLSVAS